MYDKPVAINGLIGERNERKVWLHGLYEIVEYHGYEPSAYVWSPGYTILPAGDIYSQTNDSMEENLIWVDADDLKAQVNPKAHGAELRHEREEEIERMLEYERERSTDCVYY